MGEGEGGKEEEEEMENEKEMEIEKKKKKKKDQSYFVHSLSLFSTCFPYGFIFSIYFFLLSIFLFQCLRNAFSL